ncbi:MAG: phosphomannomutase/phosphoglucomutase [Clostridia bacterium]|nr:phosphomannomutase/phosphoglucomutase [Clostridia bacterium]
MKELISLLSGTDVRGVAVGEKNVFDAATVAAIASAFVDFASELLGKAPCELTVAVGRDCRISGERIAGGIIRAVAEKGCRVLDCGMASTPAMFMSTVLAGADAAVQVTASHHPADRNGIKFFTAEGGFNASQVKEILQKAELLRSAGVPEEPDASADVSPCGLTGLYYAHLRGIISSQLGADAPLSGMKIAVDAGNGVGGFFATDVLAPLGADVSGSVYLEPDGTFPNHVPNPEAPEAMDSLRRAVLDSGSELGLCFDTDVDRAACVDEAGLEINRNRLIALAAAVALEGHPGGVIVTDSVTSDGLKKFIENDLGGVHYRYRRGYKNVIDKARELCAEGVDCPLAIETSGHAALRENYFLDDGAYLMTKIVILAAKMKKEGGTLASLIEKLEEPESELEKRFTLTREDFAAEGDEILKDLVSRCEKLDWATPAPDNREGFRASFDASHGDGWFLLRRSVHDPVMVLNIESRLPDGAARIFEEFTRLCPGLR